nr:hypothetical protein [Paenibacillus terrae]
MAAKADAHVHLERLEEAENEGAKHAEAGDTGEAGLPNEEIHGRDTGDAVSLHNKQRLVRAGYYDFPAQYERLRQLHLNG